MAIMQLASLHGDDAYVNAIYDDVTRICSQIQWANNYVGHTISAVVVVGTRTLMPKQTAAPGTSGTINLTGQNRFNVDTDFVSVELGG